MPKIFISHSSKDNDFAAKLADALREHGAEVWIDLADIPAGMKWSKAIQLEMHIGRQPTHRDNQLFLVDIVLPLILNIGRFH